jgi:hypothetical protein
MGSRDYPYILPAGSKPSLAWVFRLLFHGSVSCQQVTDAWNMCSCPKRMYCHRGFARHNPNSRLLERRMTLHCKADFTFNRHYARKWMTVRVPNSKSVASIMSQHERCENLFRFFHMWKLQVSKIYSHVLGVCQGLQLRTSMKFLFM